MATAGFARFRHRVNSNVRPRQCIRLFSPSVDSRSGTHVFSPRMSPARSSRWSPAARLGRMAHLRTVPIPFQSAAALNAPPRANVVQLVGAAALAAAKSERLWPQWCRLHHRRLVVLAPSVPQLLHQSRCLTLRCTRIATAGFARFRNRVSSNVRPRSPPAMHSVVSESLIDFVATELRVNPSRLGPATRLQRDLGVDGDEQRLHPIGDLAP